MFDTASGWLITSLDANPITVSLVQVAVSLPLFLFTLPSGALADVIDSRRLLIAVEVAILAVSVVFAGLVSLKLATPSLLLATTFLLGVGGALASPAWGATIPMLAPKQDLDSATAANGVAFNIGRAAGVRIHLIVRKSRFASALGILFENFERELRSWTFKLRNRRSRREQLRRARRSASDRTGGKPAAGAVPCPPRPLRQRPDQREARRANEAARKRSRLC